MPVMNAVHTAWDSVYLPLPFWTDGQVSQVWNWNVYRRFLVESITTKQISAMDFDTTTIKGDPRGSMWNVGETVWQIDVSIPFLIPTPIDTWDLMMLDNGETIPVLTEEFPNSFNNDIYPHCANLPVESNIAMPISKFIHAAINPVLGFDTISSGQGMWNTFWSPSSNPDLLIQRLSVDIKEERAMLSMSLICTQDPRGFLKIRQEATVNTPLRMAKPWDFSIPYGVSYLGSNISYAGGYGSIPQRGEWIQSYNHGLVREWGFTIQSQISRFKSVGTPSGRPFLGVTSIGCEGNMKYVPITYTGTGATLIDDTIVDSRLPVGWMVDTQSIEGLQRSGGQLYITGQPPYGAGNPGSTQQAVFLAMNMKKGDKNGAVYSVVGADTLGPIGVAAASFNAAAGSENTVSIDFKTLVGISSSELSSVIIG